MRDTQSAVTVDSPAIGRAEALVAGTATTSGTEGECGQDGHGA